MNSNANKTNFSDGKQFKIFSSNGKQVNMKISDEELAKRKVGFNVAVVKKQ